MNFLTILTPDNPAYPQALVQALGEQAPERVAYLGKLSLLERPLLALFCSVKCPASLIVAAQDAAKGLRAAQVATVSGFHSPVEKEMLTVLLAGEQPIIMVVARSLKRIRLKREWQKALDEERLLLIAPFQGAQRRASARMALRRNGVVAALAGAAVLIHASPGGKTEAFAGELVGSGKPVYTLKSRHNEHLIRMGLRSMPAQLDNVLEP